MLIVAPYITSYQYYLVQVIEIDNHGNVVRRKLQPESKESNLSSSITEKSSLFNKQKLSRSASFTSSNNIFSQIISSRDHSAHLSVITPSLIPSATKVVMQDGSNPSPKIFRKYSLNSTTMPGWNSSSRNSFADDQPISFGKEKSSKWWKVVEKMTGRRKSTTGLENTYADFLSNQRTRSERDASPTNSICSFKSIAEVTRPIDLASTI